MDQVSEFFEKLMLVERKKNRLRNGPIAPILVRLKDGTGRIKKIAENQRKRIIDRMGLSKTLIKIVLTQTDKEFNKKIMEERDRLKKEEEGKGGHFYFRIRNDKIVRTWNAEMSHRPTESQATTAQQTELNAPEIYSSYRNNNFQNCNKKFIFNKVLRSESIFCNKNVQSQESNVNKPDLVNGKTFLTFLATNAASLGNKLSELKASLSIDEPPHVVCVVEI